MLISSAVNFRKSLWQHGYRKFHLPNINQDWGAAEGSSGQVWKREEGRSGLSCVISVHCRDLGSSLTCAPDFPCNLRQASSPYLSFLLCKINNGVGGGSGEVWYAGRGFSQIWYFSILWFVRLNRQQLPDQQVSLIMVLRETKASESPSAVPLLTIKGERRLFEPNLKFCYHCQLSHVSRQLWG